MQPPTRPSCRQCRRRLVFWSVSRQLRMLLKSFASFVLTNTNAAVAPPQSCIVILTVFGEGTRKCLSISYVLLFLRKKWNACSLYFCYYCCSARNFVLTMQVSRTIFRRRCFDTNCKSKLAAVLYQVGDTKGWEVLKKSHRLDWWGFYNLHPRGNACTFNIYRFLGALLMYEYLTRHFFDLFKKYAVFSR